MKSLIFWKADIEVIWFGLLVVAVARKDKENTVEISRLDKKQYKHVIGEVKRTMRKIFGIYHYSTAYYGGLTDHTVLGKSL